MDRTWFPSSRPSDPFLRHDAGVNRDSRKHKVSPRDKTWTTVLECALLGGMVLIVAIRAIS